VQSKYENGTPLVSNNNLEDYSHFAGAKKESIIGVKLSGNLSTINFKEQHSNSTSFSPITPRLGVPIVKEATLMTPAKNEERNTVLERPDTIMKLPNSHQNEFNMFSNGGSPKEILKKPSPKKEKKMPYMANSPSFRKDHTISESSMSKPISIVNDQYIQLRQQQTGEENLSKLIDDVSIQPRTDSQESKSKPPTWKNMNTRVEKKDKKINKKSGFGSKRMSK